VDPEERALPRTLTGPGVFTVPHGPVRSGVTESVQYVIETPGEDIPRLQIRLHHKHRGVSKSFEGRTPEDGVLIAERVEGTASVAHALAFAHAVERAAGLTVPWTARLVRVLHAELERVAAHLDTMVRLTDAAGLAVATARFGVHKERVQRLVGRLCGSRFGRTVVLPGGVRALPGRTPAQLARELPALRDAITADWRAAMATPSFLDRLRGTGRLDPAPARAHGALGPIGRRPAAPRTPAASAPTTPIRRSASARSPRTPAATRWPAPGCAAPRSPSPSTCSTRSPRNWRRSARRTPRRRRCARPCPARG
jgi:Ni,Fe-hydrogenase III large subunit